MKKLLKLAIVGTIVGAITKLVRGKRAEQAELGRIQDAPSEPPEDAA